MHTLLDTRESTLRTQCISNSAVDKRDFLGLCLNWMVHVMMHSTCIAVWFYVFFIYLLGVFPSPPFMHSLWCYRHKSLEYPASWNHLKSFKGYQLPPSSLCRYLLPADSSTKQAEPATGTYIQPCYPVFQPPGSPYGLWKYFAIRQLTEMSKDRFAKASHPLFTCEVIGQSPWTSRDLVLPATFKGL